MRVLSWSEHQSHVPAGDTLELALKISADAGEAIDISFIVLLGPTDLAGLVDKTDDTNGDVQFIDGIVARLTSMNEKLRVLPARVAELEDIVARQSHRLRELGACE